jgi:hypothetical protein
VLSMLASLWPNGSTQRAHARRLAGDGETKPGAAKALRRRGGLAAQ